jgi:hypothetical protein
MRGLLAATAVVLMAACAASSGGGGGPADVAVQSSDVPKGLQKCGNSGDMDFFLNASKTNDPATYQSTKTQWDDAKSRGAVAAQVVFYADSKDHCTAIEQSQNEVNAAIYPIVMSFVIQFKDEATAGKGYTTESIFSFSEATVCPAGQTGITTGPATGLGKNSCVLMLSIPPQHLFLAVWQNKAYMVVLAVLNIDITQAQKIASTENGRIH